MLNPDIAKFVALVIQLSHRSLFASNHSRSRRQLLSLPTLAATLMRVFHVGEEDVTEKITPTVLWVEAPDFQQRLQSLMNPSAAVKRDIGSLVDFLKRPQIEHLKWFQKAILGEEKSLGRPRGSFVTRKSYIWNGVQFGRHRVYLVSTVRVVEAIYVPRYRLVLSARREPKTTFADELVGLIRDDTERFRATWRTPAPKALAQLVHRPRILHNVSQELRASWESQEILDPPPGLFILERGAFFKASFYKKFGGQIVSAGELRRVARNHTLYSFWWSHRSNEIFNNRVRETVLDCSNQVESFPTTGKKALFLEISSGERRSFVDEVEAMVSIIDWAKSRWGDTAFFVFNGYTASSTPTSNHTKVIDCQKNILSRILGGSGLSSEEYHSLIGSHAEEKILAASKCVAFVSSGSPVQWPLWFGGLPGVIHGSPRALEEAMKLFSGGQGEQKALVISPEQSRVVAFDDSRNLQALKGGRTWASDNYSIGPKLIVDCLQEVIDRHVD